MLPPRLHEPIQGGPLSERVITHDEVDTLVRDYYAAQGWDAETGVPTAATLRALEQSGRDRERLRLNASQRLHSTGSRLRRNGGPTRPAGERQAPKLYGAPPIHVPAARTCASPFRR